MKDYNRSHKIYHGKHDKLNTQSGLEIKIIIALSNKQNGGKQFQLLVKSQSTKQEIKQGGYKPYVIDITEAKRVG